MAHLLTHLDSMHAVYLQPRIRGGQALVNVSNAPPAASADACSAAVSEAAVHHQRFKRLQLLEGALADQRCVVKALRAATRRARCIQSRHRKHAALCARYQRMASEVRGVALQRDPCSAANADYRTQLQTVGTQVEWLLAKVAFLESFLHVELRCRGSDHEGNPVLVVPDLELQTIDLPVIMVTRQRKDAAGEPCGGRQISAWLLLLCAELAAITSVPYEQAAVCVDQCLRRARTGRLSECATTLSPQQRRSVAAVVIAAAALLLLLMLRCC